MIIEYEIRLFDNDEIIAERRPYIRHLTSQVNYPELLAKDLAEAWFEPDEWKKHFGNEESGDVIVEFFTPEDIEGRYRVPLILTVTGERAEKLEEAKS